MMVTMMGRQNMNLVEIGVGDRDPPKRRPSKRRRRGKKLRKPNVKRKLSIALYLNKRKHFNIGLVAQLPGSPRKKTHKFPNVIFIDPLQHKATGRFPLGTQLSTLGVVPLFGPQAPLCSGALLLSHKERRVSPRKKRCNTTK